MKYTIQNFSQTCSVDLSVKQHQTLGNLVTLQHQAGGMLFQHSMTPQQAREMADALHSLARLMERAS